MYKAIKNKDDNGFDYLFTGSPTDLPKSAKFGELAYAFEGEYRGSIFMFNDETKEWVEQPDGSIGNLEQALAEAREAAAVAMDAAERSEEVLNSIPEDYTELESSVGELKQDLDSKCKRTYQLFDKRNYEVRHYYINGSNVISNQRYVYTVIFPCHVTAGERIAFKTEGNATANTIRMFASSTIPEVGDTLTQVVAGYTTQTLKYAGFVASDDAEYIGISFVFASATTDEEINARVDALIDNLAVAKMSSGYPDYADYWILDVQEENLSDDIINKLNAQPSETSVRLIRDVEIHVDTNIVTASNTTVGAGWSGSISDGFTHVTGNTDAITVAVNASMGDEYIVEWDYTGKIDIFGFTVSLGNSYPIDVYNGTTHVIVGVKAVENGNIVITPFGTYTGTLTNLSVRKVNPNSTDVIHAEVNNIRYGNSGTELTAFWNICLGYNAMLNNINGSRNIAIGTESLMRMVSGTRNIGLGTFTIPSLVSGDENIAIGADAGLYLTEGNSSIAIGKAALSECKKSTNDIAIGKAALYGSRAGTTVENVAIGKYSGYKCTSSGNVYVGTQAGYSNASGYNNVSIGSNADVQNNANRSIAIGANAKCTKSQQCMIGSTSVTEVVFCGNKKMNFNADGSVTWETI